MSVTTNAVSIKMAMRERYCAPEYALMFEVGSGTGSNNRGWADAIAMSLYPSRGLVIHGFEFKVSRGDWKRELNNPDKAEKIAKYCDFWWIVAPDGVVPADELPVNWGHILFKDGKLRTAKAAPQLQPQEIGRSFLAAIMRRMHDVDREEIDAALAKNNEEWRAKANEMIESDRKIGRHDYERLKGRCDEIEKTTGIKLDDWTPSAEIAAAIRFAMKADLNNHAAGVGRLIKLAERVATNLREAAKDLDIKHDEVSR